MTVVWPLPICSSSLLRLSFSAATEKSPSACKRRRRSSISGASRPTDFAPWLMLASWRASPSSESPAASSSQRVHASKCWLTVSSSSDDNPPARKARICSGERHVAPMRLFAEFVAQLEKLTENASARCERGKSNDNVQPLGKGDFCERYLPLIGQGRTTRIPARLATRFAAL